MASVKGGKKISKVLAEIGSKMQGSVNVGFLAGATYPDGTSVAQVAFWNEYGTTSAPARPFFRTMVARESPGWSLLIAKAAKHYNYDAATVLQFMGVKISEELQQSIRGWSTPGNAASTIAEKGFDNPLLRTGHMQNSVDFEVNE